MPGRLAIQELPGFKSLKIEFTNVFSNYENQGSSTSRSEWLSYALSAAKVHVFNSHRETSTGMHNSIRFA